MNYERYNAERAIEDSGWNCYADWFFAEQFCATVSIPVGRSTTPGTLASTGTQQSAMALTVFTCTSPIAKFSGATATN